MLLFFKKKRQDVLAPTGSYHLMDEVMLKGNPSNPYLKDYGEHAPRKVSAKFPLWKSILHIIFFPFLRKEP